MYMEGIVKILNLLNNGLAQPCSIPYLILRHSDLQFLTFQFHSAVSTNFDFFLRYDSNQ